MDHSEYVRDKIKKYGTENIKWVSKGKKKRVKDKHGIKPDKIVNLLKKGNFIECFPNERARNKFDYEESFIVRIEKSRKYYYEIPIYFISKENKIIIATAYKNHRKVQDELDENE
ncbi:MAG: hypothetical protein ABEK36_05955 [Candidatus Aenigmatarchaeota archaeon]